VFNRETDERLLQCASRGDEAAFVEVYLRHRDAVYGFAYRLLGSKELAEDIAHDCFLSLMKNPERFNARQASLKTYLLAAVRNLALKHFRKTSGNVSFEEINAEPIISGKESPIERMIDEELSLFVQKAVMSLPPYQREALILFEYEGLSLVEIAAIVEVDVNAVKQRLHRARTNLKKILAPYIESEQRSLAWKSL
jgi:RNA polymerase sigma-70 factor (ECF subfamily)